MKPYLQLTRPSNLWGVRRKVFARNGEERVSRRYLIYVISLLLFSFDQKLKQVGMISLSSPGHATKQATSGAADGPTSYDVERPAFARPPLYLYNSRGRAHPMKTGRGICLVGCRVPGASLIRPTQLEMLFSLPQPGLTQGPGRVPGHAGSN